MVAVSCSVERFIPEDRYMLKGMEVDCQDEEVMKEFHLGDYITQRTNTKWFGVKVP